MRDLGAVGTRKVIDRAGDRLSRILGGIPVDESADANEEDDGDAQQKTLHSGRDDTTCR